MIEVKYIKSEYPVKVLSRLEVALAIVDASRRLDEVVNEQRAIMAETLLLIQEYVDSVEGR